MSLLRRKAERGRQFLLGAGFPADPDALAGFFAALLKLLGGCARSPEEALAVAARPRRVHLLRMRRTGRRHGLDPEAAEAVVADLAEETTVPEMAELLRESEVTDDE